jgi:hypothetical protein
VVTGAWRPGAQPGLCQGSTLKIEEAIRPGPMAGAAQAVAEVAMRGFRSPRERPGPLCAGGAGEKANQPGPPEDSP